MTESPPAVSAVEPPPSSSTPRSLVNMLVLFVCAFVFVRTACLEPFGVPTGSMAGTLIGNHREAFCPRCDARVVVGEPARPMRFENCVCSNCGERVNLAEAQEIPGDRLLVDKTVFHARPPRRFEVAVFRCPADQWRPYVKRVVGLPGEFVQVSGGDVYANGELLRKSLAHVRETWVPVFDQAQAPAAGWGARWRLQSLTTPRPKDRPVTDSVLDSDGTLTLDGTPGAMGLTYRHLNTDTNLEEPVPDYLAYNGPPADRRAFARGGASLLGDPVNDFAVTFALDLSQCAAADLGRVACRLFDGADSVVADLPVGGPSDELPGFSVRAEARPLAVQGSGVLTPGRVHRIEFAFIDRRASLAIDGREVVAALDLPADAAGRPRRGGVSRPVQFGVDGVRVQVRDVQIWRDIHYQSVGLASTGWQLGADDYFLLGDNSQNSHDSRVWADADGKAIPGVPVGAFLGKPFLIHQPLRLARLPAGGTLPAPDWSRLRFLR